MHIRFCRYIWAELSLLFWTFLSGTSLAYAPALRSASALLKNQGFFNWVYIVIRDGPVNLVGGGEWTE